MIAGYRDGPSLHWDAESAYYVPEHDEVHVPPRAAFTDAHGYYATLFHELAYSTGHPSRLAREGYRTAAHFGSKRYSQEELVAEFAAGRLGMTTRSGPTLILETGSARRTGAWAGGASPLRRRSKPLHAAPRAVRGSSRGGPRSVGSGVCGRSY